MYPCHQFVGDSDFKMGNVFDNTFDRNIGPNLKMLMYIIKRTVKTVGLNFIAAAAVMQMHINLIKIFKNLIKLVVKWRKKGLNAP